MRLRALFISLCLVLLCTPAFASEEGAGVEAAPVVRPPEMEKALTQLNEFAERRLQSICKFIRPCIDQKDVVQTGDEYIARYLAVDLENVNTEITVAQGSGAKYIGSVIYFEQIYESRGPTKEEALAGEFELVRMRHVTELFRYNRGKWID